MEMAPTLPERLCDCQKLGDYVSASGLRVREDYKRLFGEEPENPRLISISIDSNDTRSTAESLIGLIQFLTR